MRKSDDTLIPAQVYRFAVNFCQPWRESVHHWKTSHGLGDLKTIIPAAVASHWRGLFG